MSSYPLPSTDEERARLAMQAAFMGPITRRLFTEAGLAPGMRVLDVGSGGGDVALLARTFVGNSGEIVGYDQNVDQVAYAQKRAEEAGFTNLRFVQASTDSFQSEATFDAAVGRFTLMYHPDLDGALARIASHVRPGGMLAFHEMSYGTDPGGWPQMWPPMSDPSWQDKLHTIIRTMAASGVNMVTGPAMVAGLTRLGETKAWAEQIVWHGLGGVEAALALLRSLLPRAEALGVVKPGEIDIEALRAQAQAHAATCTPVTMTPTQVAAWARKH